MDCRAGLYQNVVKMGIRNIAIFVGWMGCALGSASAAEYNGRATTGAYTSREKFSSASDGSQSNDFATFSNRLYLNVFNLGSHRGQWITDLRDKHDFFDKLDRERMSLTSQNRLQLRQFSFKDPNEGGIFYFTLGRFPVPESGATFTDGAEVGIHWTPALNTGLFGGLNPKRDDQSYLTFQKDGRVFGGYLLYDPHKQSWGNSAYMANALTAKEYRGQIDRLFWFHNSIFQFSRASRLINMVYLDFKPTFRLQNLNVSYRHDFSKSVAGSARVSAVDVVEYLRKQGLRERLPPSPYREAEVSAELRGSQVASYTLTGSRGVRLVDGKTRDEVKLGGSWSRFLLKYLAANSAVGVRKNFDSHDLFLRAGFSLYSKWWEFSLTEELASERYMDGTRLTPIISELSAAHFFSRAIYATLSSQYAKDERVDIFSIFFKLSYRFGSENIPPLRDGAPPPGGV